MELLKATRTLDKYERIMFKILQGLDNKDDDLILNTLIELNDIMSGSNWINKVADITYIYSIISSLLSHPKLPEYVNDLCNAKIYVFIKRLYIPLTNTIKNIKVNDYENQ